MASSVLCPLPPLSARLHRQLQSLAYFNPSRPIYNPRWHRQPFIRAAARDDDIEVAVFRFTLGIPGFDDALIPRVVGIIGASLVLINHVLSPQPVPLPQTRIEILGAALAAVAVAAPTLQQRLEELKPGRGRRAAAESVPGGSNVFALDSDLPENVRQDLAWTSYALLKNANTCGMMVVWNGKVLMCRGILGSSIASKDAKEVLQRATEALGGASWLTVENNQQLGTSVVLFEDKSSMNRAGVSGCACVPEGANTVAVVPLRPLEYDNNKESSDSMVSMGALVLVSERERALSGKEQRWAQGVAAKLYSVFNTF